MSAQQSDTLIAGGERTARVNERFQYTRSMERLIRVTQDLSMARSLASVQAIVRRAARALTCADGATFVLREGEYCYYADEDAISPLWKGRRFPLESCISGWVMENRKSACIEDIYQDARIPADAYRPTFVKSLTMVPIRSTAPIGAIGNYWATRHRPTRQEVFVLQALADLTSVAIENVRLLEELETRAEEKGVLYERTRAALAQRDEFLAIAAHEFRTPLQALQLQLQHLHELTDDRMSQGRLERATRSSKRLGQLVDRLVESSRLEQGQCSRVLTHFDLGEVVEQVARDMAATASRAQCEFELQRDPNLMGRWDREQIIRVTDILLSNAFKYGAGTRVDVRVSGDEGAVRLTVSDRGIGMAAECLPRVFGRFERAVSVRNYGGLGLGLFVARQIVDGHGGRISVASELGAGATFTMEIPRAPPVARTEENACSKLSL